MLRLLRSVRLLGGVISPLPKNLENTRLSRTAFFHHRGFSSNNPNKDLAKEKFDSGELSAYHPDDVISDDTKKLDEFMNSDAKDIDPSKMSILDLEKKGAVPGHREDFVVPTLYETAVGWERYEYLCELEGKDPWTEFRSIPLTRRPTAEMPLKIKGVDPVFYLGCSGYPVDTHELLWLTLSPHGEIDRCPKCGNCFKYTQVPVPGHEHHHDHSAEKH